ncbi:MAG TPA: TIGR04190 family B12-binding domain/radical SAM domain protein [Thermodesulfovibrionales bacterium]|nr:TIGR04190 family B12-binding domain/radical SAM domain protein [Thermodesulfovibrionales bacterium]
MHNLFRPRPDLILLHPPTVFRFRERPGFYGPMSDVIPSSSIFEIYPIGFLAISDYLYRHGIPVRIVNLAMKMLRAESFNPEKFIKKLDALAFGIDLHWLPHADGSLCLAEMLKKHHPGKPVILGGLSATYYHGEIMADYPFVDFIVLGDSAEEPLRMLMEAIKSGTGFESVPNLVWRDGSGKVITNELSNRPENLDDINFDYLHLLKMAIKYRDPSGYIPFRYWLSYPVTAVFQCRGCVHNCASCAGSLSSFKRVCMREKPCFRSPELLAEDIRKISEYTGAPVMVIGDLLQAREDYAGRFLDAVKKYRIKNELTVEFFTPPPETFIRKVADCIENFNVEVSPESHDPKIRKAFGKHYENKELEQMIATLLDAGCKRIDIFFMVGLPYQDYRSVMETVGYCEELLRKFGRTRRLLPMIAPLAPFVDPGSGIFEEPEKFGYRLLYKSLKEHRQAMLMPSWKYTLNYETEWMTREDIVKATYDGALMLLDIKEKYQVIGKEKASMIREHIEKAKVLIEHIDSSGQIDDATRTEILHLNNLASLCDKRELDWPIKGWRLNLPKIFKSLLK